MHRLNLLIFGVDGHPTELTTTQICVRGLLIFIVVAALTLRQTPVYTATANVLLDTRQRDVIRVQSVTPNLSPDTSTSKNS